MNQECILMNVKISEEVRRFSGILNELQNYEFTRFFAILADKATGRQLRDMGWVTRIRKTPETCNGEYPFLMHVTVDYEYNTPEIEVVFDDRSFFLDEKTVGCLDHMIIDYANLVIEPITKYNDDGEAYMVAHLKCMKVYVKSELDEFYKIIGREQNRD